jgi:disulfide bond formation protein DsbB
MKIETRWIHAGVFVACVGLIAYAMVLQHFMDLEPCPMCILQRYAFVGVGLLALLAAIHDRRGWGRWVYSGLIILVSSLGAGVAARHSWLEHNPPPVYDCGADLGFVIDTFPLAEALPMIFRGTGDCTEVLWRFLGLSIAEWALIWFLIFVVVEVFLATRREPESKST